MALRKACLPLLFACMLIQATAWNAIQSEAEESTNEPSSSTDEIIVNALHDGQPGAFALQPDAGSDQIVYEGTMVNLDGTGSQGAPETGYWSDSFDDYSKTSEIVNATISKGSVVLKNLSFFVNHMFDTDPGFILEDDQPNTVIWWNSTREAIQWHMERGDSPMHWEKLFGHLPHPVNEAMDFSMRANYMYWRADAYAVAVLLFMQKNSSYSLGYKEGGTNNTLRSHIHGGDPAAGGEDRHTWKLFDDAGTHHMYRSHYDMHYWELFTTYAGWDSDTKTLRVLIKDSLGNAILDTTDTISEGFTFERYGVGTMSDGLPAVTEGFTDNMSISVYGYREPGWVISETISPANLQSWNVLNVSAAEASGTQIEIQVLDEFGSPIVAGISPADCPLLLDGLVDPMAYPRIRLKAILSTDRNETPALSDWNVSYYTETPIIGYKWDVNQLVDSDGDGNYTNDVDLVGDMVSYVYGDDGFYIAHLTVEDSLGDTSIDSCNITVLNVDPIPSLMPPAAPEEGVPLAFNASAYDPGSDDLIFTWDWGDDSNESWTYYNDGMGPDPPNSPDVNPITVVNEWNHTYGHGGTYVVNLTVVDDDGGHGTILLQLNVSNVGPIPAIDISEPNPVSEGFPVLLGGYFDDPSWLDNHTVLWDFGDGQNMSGNFTPGVGFSHHIIENITHVYGDDGIFQVTLNVTDDFGASSKSSAAVTILNRPPTANISCPVKVSIGHEFQCSSTATDPGSDDLVFDWIWGDGTMTQHIHYNDGIGPDPYPSPDPVYPFSTEDVVTHRYYSIGNFTVLLNITDDDGGSITLMFDIEVVGHPDTTIVIGDPKYESTEVYIKSSTPISFSTWDRSGEGIDSTFYRIDDGDWNRYLSPFHIMDEGPHTVYYNSTDLLGGVEETKNFSLMVDDTPPSSDVAIGEPNYTSTDLWLSPFTPLTPLTITSADDGCGLSYIEYQLDGGNWQDYAIPFSVQDEGSHTLSYRGIDRLGNTEDSGTITFIVDGSPPWSTIDIGTPRRDRTPIEVYMETPFIITSLDNGSGLRDVTYRIDSGQWTNYTEDFNLSDYDLGEHTIQFRGVDNLDNTESTRSLSVILIAPAAKQNLKPLLAIAFAFLLALVGLIVALRKPFVSEQGKKKALTYAAIVLPFAVAEIITGILSLFIADIRIPPWIGFGMLLDLGILIGGLITQSLVYFRKTSVTKGTKNSTKPIVD